MPHVDIDKASILRLNEFGTDGGPAAKELLPKLNILRKNVSTRFGFDLPVIDVSSCSSVDWTAESSYSFPFCT